MPPHSSAHYGVCLCLAVLVGVGCMAFNECASTLVSALWGLPVPGRPRWGALWGLHKTVVSGFCIWVLHMGALSRAEPVVFTTTTTPMAILTNQLPETTQEGFGHSAHWDLSYWQKPLPTVYAK